jgi:hypothetical protein
MRFAVKALATLLFVSAFAPTVQAATTTNGSVLITRLSTEKWQVTVTGGSQRAQLSSVIESSVPYYNLTRVQLESDDTARLATSKQVALALNVYPGGVDTVTFTLPASATLCLRDTGSTNVKTYRGTQLATATLVAAPISLLGTDACDGTITPPPGTGGRKYHPGHYAGMLRLGDSQAIMETVLQPGITGIMKRYSWRQLEPTAGNYDFSELQADLQWAQARGVRIIAMVEDKTFTPDRATPEYLNAYSVRNSGGGYTTLRWNSYVVGRMKLLFQAMGRFDSNPWLEGIATQETALSLPANVLDANGYTPEKYRDAYISVLGTASTSFPTSRIFWFMNYFPRNQAYIGSIATAMIGKGVVMGGPDVLPDDETHLTMTYPFYDQFQGKLPLFGQVEDICYRHLHATGGYSTKYWTPAESFRFARDDLHVNYMIWVRIPVPSPSDAYTWYDALPAIAANPTFN